MAYRGWFQLGDVELVNATRTERYMDTVGCSQSVALHKSGAWPGMAEWLQHEEYRTPLEDAAPWTYRERPETGEFLGMIVLGVNGLDSAPLERGAIESSGAGGSFEPPRWSVREAEFEAVLLAATPAGLEWGIEWLNSALLQDQCQRIGVGRSLRFMQTAPRLREGATGAEVRAAAVEEERLLHNVVCTSPVVVEERFGRWEEDDAQSTAARISFTLSAGNPFVWKSARSLVAPTALYGGELRTVRFETVDENGQIPGTEDENPPLFDPFLPPPVHLPRPMTPASEVGRQPFQSKHTELTIPGDTVRPWETMVPTVTIIAGAEAERSVRVQWVRGSDTGALSADSIGEAMIGYIPPRAVLTLDGVTGRATVLRDGAAEEADATSVVTGRGGAPWRAPVMRCGEQHTLVVQADRDVSPEAAVAAYGNVRMN